MGVLVTDWRLVSVAKNTCFAFQRQFLKLFQFFPRILVTVHCLPHFSLSNTSCLTSKSIHFCIISSPIFRKKVWVLSVSLHFSCFECAFLDSVSVLMPLCFEKYHVRMRVCFILVIVLWLRVSVFDFITVVYIKFVLYALCSVSWICCFIHIMFLVYCHIIYHLSLCDAQCLLNFELLLFIIIFDCLFQLLC